MPIMIFLLGAVPFVLSRRLRLPTGLGGIAGALVFLGGALVLVLSFAFWGTTMRYEMDFASLFLLAALLVWLAAVAATRRPVRRVLAVGGTSLIAYGALVGVAISMTATTTPCEPAVRARIARWNGSSAPCRPSQR